MNGDDDILNEHPKLWLTLKKAVDDEDVKVREQFVKCCEQLMIKRRDMTSHVENAFKSFHLDKKDTVREKLTEAIKEIANHDVKLVSKEIWGYVELMSLDKKEKIRAGAISAIVETFSKYFTDDADEETTQITFQEEIQIFFSYQSQPFLFKFLIKFVDQVPFFLNHSWIFYFTTGCKKCLSINWNKAALCVSSKNNSLKKSLPKIYFYFL